MAGAIYNWHLKFNTSKCEVLTVTRIKAPPTSLRLQVVEQELTYTRVSMGLTDRRKKAKNLVDSRKN